MKIPQNYQETLAQQVRWAARNLSHNLDFLPADKLEWKPAPDAPSALEIVNHLLVGMRHAQSVIRAGRWLDETETLSPVSDLSTAKTRLVQIADEFALTLEAVQSDQMEQVLDAPFGELSLADFLRFEPIDIVHHHGQIAYIQQLLGDKEDHFDPDAR